MKNGFILEIQEFNGGQDFETGIHSFVFPQFAHINVGMAGTGKKMSEKLTEITAFRGADQYSTLFINQVEKTFPKMTLTPERSIQEKILIFTFYEARLNQYSLERVSGSTESKEMLSFTFSKFSTAEFTGYNGRAKTADRIRKQTLNFIKG